MTAAVAEPAGPPAEDLEDFELYPSGATVMLRCIQCGQIKNLGRIVLEALVDEAEAHAEVCPGRPEPVT